MRRDAPLVVLVAALLAYGGSAWWLGHDHAGAAVYFDQLAVSFLDGRLDLREPATDYDLTQHNERWYVPFPPLPAVLMMPWIALMGLGKLNAVYFSVAIGAANVVLVSAILDALAERRWIELSRSGRRWLVLLFALGCVHWQVAMDGAVWFVAQTCTVTFIALAVWTTIAHRSAVLSGLALAVALWGRPNVILLWPLLLAIIAMRQRDELGRFDRAVLIRWTLKSAVPLVLSILGLMAYNYARFDDPFDFGYIDQNVSRELLYNLHNYGQFSVHHLWGNLKIVLLGPPRWPADLSYPVPNADGMSLLLTTPALFYLVRLRRRDVLTLGAWTSVGLLITPLLLYYNTGWRQFGYRFSLDFMVPLIVLLALAAGSRVSQPLRALILAGVAVNAWGVIWWYTNAL